MQIPFRTKFQICLFVQKAAIINIRTNKLLADRWILLGLELCNSPTGAFSGVKVLCWPDPLVLSPENVSAIHKSMTSNVRLLCSAIVLKPDCIFYWS